MLDIQSFNNALKAKWVQRYLDPNNKGKWKWLLDFFLHNHAATALFSGNLKPEDVATLEIEDPFTKELIESWCCLKFNRNPPSLSRMSIWYNSLIRINGKPVFYVMFVTKTRTHTATSCNIMYSNLCKLKHDIFLSNKINK